MLALCPLSLPRGWCQQQGCSPPPPPTHSQCRPWSPMALRPQAKFLPSPFLRGDFIRGHPDQKPETVGCAIACIPASPQNCSSCAGGLPGRELGLLPLQTSSHWRRQCWKLHVALPRSGNWLLVSAYFYLFPAVLHCQGGWALN